ncbi:hypothetical protein OU787_28515 [Kitasatospora sp. YST-16]|uniref:hypothetical protein n=1 Tax=Kitasatospora sp. YST-16 TaxID=2998080 RepID=UPI00228418D8|nr:hypothetical protein [Kitasatospora sp. YST-16]WAL75118.1 hypothetical protein OU787_28515 [Kitasatospora sp. YST-16]WNW41176.1 hypothetical protein RKE32_28440 [Streptomyces sp. Li-HN-5-13]
MPRALPVTFDVRVDLDLGSFLLRRRTAVAVDPADLLPAADPWSLRGLTALDADLANRGYLPTVELRAALARLAPLRLAELGGALLARIDHLLGTDREHTPLFRRFPDAVPEVAQLHHSRRMRAFLRSQPHQPCARCGRRGAEVGIGLLAPCAHLLCPDCLDAQDGPPHCPSCGTALAVHPFLFGGKRKTVREQAPPRKGDKEPREPRGSVLRPLRLLNEDETTAALAELTGLLTRRTALNPQDRDDLATLLAHAPADLAALLPAEIPVRETKALALAELLRREGASALPVLAERLTTATDVLRLLWAHSGAEPDLLPATARRLRLRNLPRPLRRGLLGVLDALPAASLAEDLRRHREPWLRVGELLHPFEHARQFPSAAAAFALLRGTDLDAATAAPGLAEPPAPLRVERVRGRRRLAHTGFAARVESLLAVGDAPARWPNSRTGRASWCAACTTCCGCTRSWSPARRRPPHCRRRWPGRCPRSARARCSARTAGCAGRAPRASGGSTSRAGWSRWRTAGRTTAPSSRPAPAPRWSPRSRRSCSGGPPRRCPSRPKSLCWTRR